MSIKYINIINNNINEFINILNDIYTNNLIQWNDITFKKAFKWAKYFEKVFYFNLKRLMKY